MPELSRQTPTVRRVRPALDGAPALPADVIRDRLPVLIDRLAEHGEHGRRAARCGVDQRPERVRERRESLLLLPLAVRLPRVATVLPRLPGLRWRRLAARPAPGSRSFAGARPAGRWGRPSERPRGGGRTAPRRSRRYSSPAGCLGSPSAAVAGFLSRTARPFRSRTSIPSRGATSVSSLALRSSTAPVRATIRSTAQHPGQRSGGEPTASNRRRRRSARTGYRQRRRTPC